MSMKNTYSKAAVLERSTKPLVSSDLSNVSINSYNERFSIEKITVSIESIFDCYLLKPQCLLKMHIYMQNDLI